MKEVSLKELELSDAEAIVEMVKSPVYDGFFGANHRFDLKGMKNFILSFKDKNSAIKGIYLDKELIGFIYYKPFIMRSNDFKEMAYLIKEEFFNLGYATEAIRQFLELYNYNFLAIFGKNKASEKALLKNSFNKAKNFDTDLCIRNSLVHLKE